METVGYAHIKSEATSGESSIPMSNFLGKVVRVVEFDTDGNVMVINSEATGIATFDACDIYRKFECGIHGNIITPPGIGLAGKLAYAGKVLYRKGSYNHIAKQMVIEASLRKGEFTDDFLFSEQNNTESSAQAQEK